MKVSELPEFSAVLDAHGNVLGADRDYEGDDEDIGTMELDEPLARHWLEALPAACGDSQEVETFVAPLSDLIRRVSALSGVDCPDLDVDENAFATAIEAGGFADDT